jgi:hypothetical protein
MQIQLKSPNNVIDELFQRIQKLERKESFKQTSKFKKIKKRTCELLELSTSHGVPNIFRTKNLFILIIWSFFTILSASFGSYLVLDSILDYLKYNTVTKIELINEQLVPFPAISMCAYPSFDSSLKKSILISRFNDIIETDLNQFYEKFEDSVLNNCFRYNSGPNIQYSTIGGLKYGFKLNMKIQVPNNNDFVEFYLFIHNKSSPPFDTYNSRGYWLATGSWNYFELDRVFYKKLNSPYSDCLNNVNLFKKNKTLIDHISKVNRTYTQNDCYYLCSHLFALKESECGCNSTFDDYSKNCFRQINKQAETEVQKCNAKYLNDFRKNDQYEKCSEYCPLECDRISYLITPYSEQISSANGNISKTPKSNYFSEFNTYEEVKKSFIGIRIYYNELKYTLISEEPKTELLDFISNIGGILGLFLGISFLSFIEIFEIIFEIVFIILQK